MKALRKIGQFAVLPVIAVLMTFSGVAAQWDHFPTAAEVAPDDALEETLPSLGGFIVRVIPQRRYLFVNYPNFDQQKGQLRSPETMYDTETKIGMSVMHHDDDPEDAGCWVGLGTNKKWIGDGSFVNKKFGYHHADYPNIKAEEVHTNIISMELVDEAGSAVIVRAGIAQGGTLCPGEVQSIETDGIGLTGQSFFDVSVIVTLPDVYGIWGGGDMDFYNQYPMFIENKHVDSLPPIVLYIHQGSTAVPVYFLDDNLPYWSKDDLLGHVELAGHGMGYSKSDKNAFWLELDQPENYLPVPKVPTLNEWGLLVLLALLLVTGIWVAVRRRKQVTA